MNINNNYNIKNSEGNLLKNTDKNWYLKPYDYYKSAKEIFLPFNLFETLISSINDPSEDEIKKKTKEKKNFDTINADIKNKNKLVVPIIETILIENGQIIGWYYYDNNAGYVKHKTSKKFDASYTMRYFLTQLKNYEFNGTKIFKKISENKVLQDLSGFAPYLLQKSEKKDIRMYKKNKIEYILDIEKIKFILVYYYSKTEPIYMNFVEFYFMLIEQGAISNIKMIQNCINCRSLNQSFNKLDFTLNEDNIKQVTVKYSKSDPLKPKKYSIYYNKPKILFENNMFLNLNIKREKFSDIYFDLYGRDSFFTYTNFSNRNKRFLSSKKGDKFLMNNYPNNTIANYNIKTNKNKNKRISITAVNEDQTDIKQSIIGDNQNNIRNSGHFSPSKKSSFGSFSKSMKKSLKMSIGSNNDNNEDKNKLSEVYNFDDEKTEKKFKFYLKNGEKNDGKILDRMEKIEDNLIIQNNDSLNYILSNLSEQIIKFIENKKSLIVIYTYFVFIRIKCESGEIYAFQKALLLYGVDKKEEAFLQKTNALRQNMKNIIYKRIPEDVSKFKSFEKFTKNDFCHGEFCKYILPNYFRGIKEQHNNLSNNNKVPKENKISIRDKNNELPCKLPLFEIKKVYDNPELANLVLKAYSIFPPDFNKELTIEKIIKQRHSQLLAGLPNQNNDNNLGRASSKSNRLYISNNNTAEENKMLGSGQDIADEYGSIMESTEKITEKINEYETEFKRKVIVYTPTPGKFLHIDYNDMYTEKGVCEKCHIIYTIILDFVKNIDECTAEFKSLTKAKNYLIKGENLKTNNFEDKNSNDNNLIIQEELGKMSVKKFLGIKILKLKLEELNKFKKKQRTRIERNETNHKQELNKTFNYNININLKLLLANLLADKTNNQFFTVLFNELYNEDDSVFKHLDIKKPKIVTEKTNMKDLRLQMGVSSQSYNPKIYGINTFSENENIPNSLVNQLIKKNTDKKKKSQFLKNIQKQMSQIDKNIFQEYKILYESDLGLDEKNKEQDINEESNNLGINQGLEYNNKNPQLDKVLEYYHTSYTSLVPRSLSMAKSYFNNNKYLNKLKRSFINFYNTEYKYKEDYENVFEEEKEKDKDIKKDQENSINIQKKINLIRNKSVIIHKGITIIKNYEKRIKNPLQVQKTLKKQNLMVVDIAKKKQLFGLTPLKSLEEIQRQKDKQFEEFMGFNRDKKNKDKDKSNLSDSLLLNNNNSRIDYSKISDDSDMVKWDKSKVILTSLFYAKTSDEFKENNNSPFYYYRTTPFPKLQEVNSTHRIEENPLEHVRRMTAEEYGYLGNFFEYNNNASVSKTNNNQEKGNDSNRNNNNNVDEINGSNKSSLSKSKEEEKTKIIFEDSSNNEEINENPKKLLLNSSKVEIYVDDKSTAVPYEILEYDSEENNYDKNKKCIKTSQKNIINDDDDSESEEKKYIVFVINDFYDCYIKYKLYFRTVLSKLSVFNNIKKNKVIKGTNIYVKTHSPFDSCEDSANSIAFNKNNIQTTKDTNNPTEGSRLKTVTNNTEKNRKYYNIQNNDSFDGENFITENDNEIKQKLNNRKYVNFLNNTNCNSLRNNKNIKKNKKLIENDDFIKEFEKKNLSKLKFVLFNLPGQSTTLFSKGIIQNNLYYSEFLDRFLYFLFDKKIFDSTYKIILLGFGNGGYIGLTYASLYEKYWSILESIIMFNSYCNNGSLINEAMLEILKVVYKANDPKQVSHYITQSIQNPKEFNFENENEESSNKQSKSPNKKKVPIPLDIKNKVKNYYSSGKKMKQIDEIIKSSSSSFSSKINSKNINFFNRNNKTNKTGNNKKWNENINNEKGDEQDEEENYITLEGYKMITKGYFYNIKINIDNISTKILCFHSNSDSFISIHGILPLFNNDISSYNKTPLEELFSISIETKNQIDKNNENKNCNMNNYNEEANKSLILDPLEELKEDERIIKEIIYKNSVVPKIDNKRRFKSRDVIDCKNKNDLQNIYYNRDSISINKNKKNKIKKNKIMGYNMDDFHSKENYTRKLIIFNGSHDVTHLIDENEDNIINSSLVSYFCPFIK